MPVFHFGEFTASEALVEDLLGGGLAECGRLLLRSNQMTPPMTSDQNTIISRAISTHPPALQPTDRAGRPEDGWAAWVIRKARQCGSNRKEPRMAKWAAPYVQVHETHSGVVALVGDRAYKAKKPVRTGFLDFSTHALREAACARELVLNRRLAPDVYLGVAHLTDPGGGASEPILVMRRMPEDRRLSTMVTNGTPLGGALAELGHLMAEFHRTARRGPDVDHEGTVGALRARWQANLHETRELSAAAPPAESLHSIERLALAYLAGRQPLFDQRIAEKCVVDGHADLIADDVFCLRDGPRVLDCLDFDEHLRSVDGVDDVAFLAMDLEYLGHPDLADEFLDGYIAASPGAAPPPSSLWHHYIAYRAFVRAKVDCIQHTQGREDAAAAACRHTDLALDHLRRGTVRLGLVGGLPGTGKSTVAAALADRVDAILLSSDRIRTELPAIGALHDPSGAYRSGTYTPEATALVYLEMLTRARVHLQQGESVILDASWTDETHRQQAATLAASTSSTLVALRCTAPRSVAAERIQNRAAGYSEATAIIAAAMAATAHPWPEASDLDTTKPVAESEGTALGVWRNGSDLP